MQVMQKIEPLGAATKLLMTLRAQGDAAHIRRIVRPLVAPVVAGIDVPRRAADQARESLNESPVEVVSCQLVSLVDRRGCDLESPIHVCLYRVYMPTWV